MHRTAVLLVLLWHTIRLLDFLLKWDNRSHILGGCFCTLRLFLYVKSHYSSATHFWQHIWYLGDMFYWRSLLLLGLPAPFSIGHFIGHYVLLDFLDFSRFDLSPSLTSFLFSITVSFFTFDWTFVSHRFNLQVWEGVILYSRYIRSLRPLVTSFFLIMACSPSIYRVHSYRLYRHIYVWLLTEEGPHYPIHIYRGEAAP